MEQLPGAGAGAPAQDQRQEPRQELVLALELVSAEMLPDVGGKAANLGELMRAGLPVPAGFCLTTQAYRRATSPAGLDAVHAALAATAADDLPGLAGLAADARRLVLAADVPADIADAVRAAYAALGTDAPVAVRSSATAEDLPFASFAGQQDTFLNVVGVDAVLAAVRQCWASLWTDRAVSYRATHGISPSTVSLAVVVQRMVDAAVAGVLFTANPVTGRRHEAVIDASPGLGEAVVSGAVNPDHFVVDSATQKILERRIGSKGVAIRPLPGGGTERVEQSGAGSAALPRRRPPRGPGAPGPPRGSAFRRAAGPRMGHRRRRSAVADAVAAHHHPLPAAGAAAGPGRDAGLPLLQPGPGPDPPADADGTGRLPADCLVRGARGALSTSRCRTTGRRRMCRRASGSSST